MKIQIEYNTSNYEGTTLYNIVSNGDVIGYAVDYEDELTDYYYIYNEDGYKIGAIIYFKKKNWCMVEDELTGSLTKYPEMNINQCIDELKLEYNDYYKPLGIDVELYLNGNLL